MLGLALSGCGITVPQIAEIYDRLDPNATLNMELQIKKAIFCELREAAIVARDEGFKRGYRGRDVTTVEDTALPHTWGAQIELTFTVDESTALAPGLSLLTPMHEAPVNFAGQTIGATGFLDAVTFGPRKIAQSYSFGLGGKLSSEAKRIDKYDYYYSMKHLIDDATNDDICHDPATPFDGPQSHSSLFLVRSNLGIKEWLPQAVFLNNFMRSSRGSASHEGPPLGEKSDSFSYDIKFVVVSDGNVTPTWTLVRVATTSNPLFDTARNREHEVLITIGPGRTADFTPVRNNRLPSYRVPVSGPSPEAANAHLASQIGNAVARAVRTP